MSTPTCKTCPAWYQKPGMCGHDEGQCRAEPPRAILMDDAETTDPISAYVIWPVMLDEDWCARHPDFVWKSRATEDPRDA